MKSTSRPVSFSWNFRIGTRDAGTKIRVPCFATFFIIVVHALRSWCWFYSSLSLIMQVTSISDFSTFQSPFWQLPNPLILIYPVSNEGYSRSCVFLNAFLILVMTLSLISRSSLLTLYSLYIYLMMPSTSSSFFCPFCDFIYSEVIVCDVLKSKY